jgi:hypothetical protein
MTRLHLFSSASLLERLLGFYLCHRGEGADLRASAVTLGHRGRGVETISTFPRYLAEIRF